MVGSNQQKLIVGLGNPGNTYTWTRHNIGERILSELALRQGWSWQREARFEGLVAKGLLGNCRLYLLLPLTYMNLSGRSVQAFLNFYRLDVEAMTVVTDDIDLPFGQLRLKPSGGPGTHRGLRNIQESLGGRQNYGRLRVGIGAPPPHIPLADYVLQMFSPEERQQLPSILTYGVEILEALMREPFERVMNRSNTRQPQQRQD